MSKTSDIPIINVPGNEKEPERFFKLYRLKNTPADEEGLSYARFKTNVPHRHHFYEILIFDQASGMHEIDFISYPVKSRNIHFISPGQVHYLSVTNDSHGYILAFSDEFYTQYEYNKSGIVHYPFFQSVRKNILQLSEEQFQKASAIIPFILHEYKQQPNPEILHTYLKALMLELQRIYEFHYKDTGATIQEDRILRHFLQILEKEFKSKKPVGEYADMLTIHTGILNSAVKKITGKTTGELILERIILEAKRLLHHSSLSQKEIAYELNFEDPSYFSRIFKRKTNFSPSEFREQVGKKYKQ